MELWIGGEIGLGSIDYRHYSKIVITIEEDLNNYLKSINYSNENTSVF
jgi:hypothetical protein